MTVVRHTLALVSTLLLTSLLLLAGPAGAATIGIAVGGGGSCFNGTANNTSESGACAQNGSGTGDDWGAAWSHSATNAPNLVGVGSTSAAFAIDAKVAADDGGADVGQGADRWVRAAINYNITLTIDVDYAVSDWTVDLNQSVLGLFALRGDGTLSAVGTQNNGSADVSLFNITVNGSGYDFSASPSSYSNNPSNNGSASQQFSGGRYDGGVLSGTGDGVYNVNIAFNLDAFSNDGCSGFICSSASGGEEAAVLFGYAPSVMDQAVDDYGTWGRASTPDGYNSTWTLNVATIPEPSTALLVLIGLAGLARGARRS